MSIFSKIKEFTKQITEVESHLYNGKKDFLEIYERNAELEVAISERTKELNLANQRMLTLQHIWDMMNSSKPLSSVLEATVNTLQGELGYLHSCILQKKSDENGDYFSIIAKSKDDSSSINWSLSQFVNIEQRIPFDKNSVIAKVLKTKELEQSTDLRAALSSILPDLKEEEMETILSETKCRSFIAIPLVKMKHFGELLVLSTRDDLTDGEANFLQMFAQQIELAITIADLFQMVKEQAATDALTTLYNRRYFEEYLEKETTRSRRQNQPYTIIGLDLDHLKIINDKYGHVYGDLAIKQISNILKQNARSIDIPARMGGEEFNVLLPGVDSQGGLIAAERIRKAIEASPVEGIGTITASIGVATFLEHSTNMEELLELADQAMYQSKRNGRNQVTLAKPISEVSWQEIAINTFTDILSKQRLPIAEEISKDLCKKLETSTAQSNNPKEMLYAIADILATTYNPLHTTGTTKSKIAFATTLARRFELSKEEADKLRVAILLYDIGNLMLPKEILQKEGPLSEEELQFIKTHPVIAARDILQPISKVQDIIPIIEKHHENWDGTGYPNNLSGNEIPLASQIILILDAYFALIEPRKYRQAMTSYEALEAIKEDANKKWNPALVEEFAKLIEIELRKAT